MIVYAGLKNPDEVMKKIQRADKIMQELRDIFGWNFVGQLEITIDGQCVEQDTTDHPETT